MSAHPAFGHWFVPGPVEVRPEVLAGLEEERFGRFRGAVHVRGLIRTYARYLGLDPEAVLKQFHDEGGEQRITERPQVVPRVFTATKPTLTITPSPVTAPARRGPP